MELKHSNLLIRYIRAYLTMPRLFRQAKKYTLDLNVDI